MAEGKTVFEFKEGDRVQFKDGRNVRQGFVVSREYADNEHPAGYTIMFKMKETNQNRLVRWAAGDLAAAFKDLGVTGAKVDADDRIIYDRGTGALSYDADGSGIAAKAVQFAVIDNHDKVALTHLDFLVA